MEGRGWKEGRGRMDGWKGEDRRRQGGGWMDGRGGRKEGKGKMEGWMGRKEGRKGEDGRMDGEEGRKERGRWKDERGGRMEGKGKMEGWKRRKDGRKGEDGRREGGGWMDGRGREGGTGNGVDQALVIISEWWCGAIIMCACGHRCGVHAHCHSGDAGHCPFMDGYAHLLLLLGFCVGGDHGHFSWCTLLWFVVVVSDVQGFANPQGHKVKGQEGKGRGQEVLTLTKTPTLVKGWGFC